MVREYCIISHTHWDREWYLPFEQFRLRLVSLMDNLIELMEKEKSYIFHLDAQTVVLEDYLEIKPAMGQRLKSLIAEGRLLVGPWYVQNDFNLVSGEATIRNLLIGIKIAEEYGGCMKVGYTPDQFGLISQLPQILSKFGIDSCIFGRGKESYVNDADGKPVKVKEKAEFYWDSEDGSRILGVYLPFWYNNAQRFSDNPDKSFYFLNKIGEQLAETSSTPYFLLMNGVDHLEAQENLLPILDNLNKMLPEGMIIRQYRLPEYIKKVKDHIANMAFSDNTPVCYSGEMRSGEDRNILQGTLSSRVGLKQMNAHCQRLLENYVEPLYTWLQMTDIGVYPREHINYAWKLLIKNHAHDSICGCHIDAVSAHMEERFARVSEVSEYLIKNALESINSHIDRSQFQKTDYILTFFNTTLYERNSVVEAEIELDSNNTIDDFAILNTDQEPIIYSVLEKKKKKIRKFSPINLPSVVDTISCKVRLNLDNIAGQSYRTYIVRPGEKGTLVEKFSNDQYESRTLENEFLKVQINLNGTIDILQKQSGLKYSNLLLFEDSEDIGDSYNYMQSYLGCTIFSSEFRPEITLIDKDVFTIKYCLEYNMQIPAGYDYGNECRSKDLVLVRARVYLQLDMDCPYLKMNIIIDNTARDHRMRVLFPTGISNALSSAGAPFDIMTRDNGKIHPKINKTAEQPFTDFVAVNGKEAGLAFFAKGLYEYEHIKGMDNTIAITLFRGNDSIYKTYGQASPEDLFVIPGNQCTGIHSFELAIYPYTGDVFSGDVLKRLHEFSIPLISCCLPADKKSGSIGTPFVQDAAISEVFVREDPYKDIILPLENQFIKLECRDISPILQ